MRLPANKLLWTIWLLATLVAGTAVAGIVFVGGGRQFLLIGKTTGAHHQIEMECGACHTSGFFADKAKVEKDMNKACLTCHEAELKLANDSHPVKKFRDPRNADRREKLDALFCTTCHAEHVPEVTRAIAVTQPMDYCLACHDDIEKERPTHKGLEFTSCASAGCHNFHDNTALYEEFLVKHAGMPDFADHPVMPFAAQSRAVPAVLTAMKSDDPLAALTAYLEKAKSDDGDDPAEAAKEALAKVLLAGDAVAPPALLTQEAVAAWAGSGHARGGVNCAGCHAPKLEGTEAGDVAVIAANWIESPGLDVCQSCHKPEAASFREGKHGMRFHPKLPGPREDAPDLGVLTEVAAKVFKDEPLGAMPVSEALIPMKPDAQDRMTGTCNACHKPHEVDLKVAAVEACASCHDDDHTRAYFTSPHYRLWQAELVGTGEPGSGVSCADCHMPKIESRRGVTTEHNQNTTLRPNEKMIRPVCLSCHSLQYSLDALADPGLVASNFNGHPTLHIESIDWAVSRTEKTK
ncbi:decaheme c-type cytochrome, DmsE family [Hartmannibacter diazotrophicus]|uniref:nitrite reductase (cytochrome; ammonia-forming) n=1 Tax=Hartmannibacter diazotrophicus TaxID=1482074 RepID=A0A2C9D3Q4_9HYPH|nr:decaheme c-type cytochrome, DmsE family [Hartmannibacter diazotrophicus]